MMMRIKGTAHKHAESGYKGHNLETAPDVEEYRSNKHDGRSGQRVLATSALCERLLRT